MRPPLFNKFSQLWRRLLFYARRNRFDRELEEEMRFHLEMKAEENLAAGISPEGAGYAAQRQFGNQTLLREVTREMWGIRSSDALFCVLPCECYAGITAALRCLYVRGRSAPARTPRSHRYRAPCACAHCRSNHRK